MIPGPSFPAGTLSRLIAERAAQALAGGALVPIDTDASFLEDHGVRFLVRRAANLQRKDADRATRAQAPRPANPFLPPEPELLVAGVSDTHVAVLNKFNVIEGHLLVVTRKFEDQEMLLGCADLQALVLCMREFESLAFYNGGDAAGASEPHRHLQLVPLPLAPEGPAVPMSPLFPPPGNYGEPTRIPAFGFHHAFAWLAPGGFARDDAAAALCETYRALLAHAGVQALTAADGPRQSAPYNLLLTRRWMLAVQRGRERCDGVSVNALGYAGSLFVRDDEEMEAVRRRGPLAMLRDVAAAG